MDDTEYAYVAIHGKPDHAHFYFLRICHKWMNLLFIYHIYIHFGFRPGEIRNQPVLGDIRNFEGWISMPKFDRMHQLLETGCHLALAEARISGLVWEG